LALSKVWLLGWLAMLKIGNHRVELQETDAYRWGWDWAALGMELHHWMLPHLGTTQMEAAKLGWQDYHDQEKSQ